MRLVLTADTHIPKRARDLPPALWAAIEGADVTIHLNPGSPTDRRRQPYATFMEVELTDEGFAVTLRRVPASR